VERPAGVAVSAGNATARRAARDNQAARAILIGTALLFLGLFLFLPLVSVIIEALRDGVTGYLDAVSDPMTLAAIRLTLLASAIAVPLNVIFGVAAAWAITRFDFAGRSVLITLIDIPFAVSPVISGMLYVLLFGAQGAFGGLLMALDVKVIFAVPGIALATIFVTFPFVARELIPFMESQGVEDEEAALVLGASGVQTFFRVTLPNIKWGLLYGVVLTSSRAMGEFGAVSVVSGHIRGETNTVPLHVEVLYNEYHFAAAFAVASLLVFTSLVSLVAKRFIAWRLEQEKKGAARDAAAAEDAPRESKRLRAPLPAAD
jgi:sulfate/thiosulfate transport system permease protein